MVHVAPGTPIKWSDLRYLTYDSDSANLSDSAKSLKNPRLIEMRIDLGAHPVYGGTGYGPTEVLEGQHTYEFDFEAQVTGIRPFWMAGGLSDSGYISTNAQTAFFVDMVFSDCPGDSAAATRWLSMRFKGCRFSHIRSRPTQVGDVVMNGTLHAQDVKLNGKPTTD